MSSLLSLRISASGLTAQRLKMDAISSNVANINTTRSSDGGPYRRREVVLGTGPMYSGALPVAYRSSSPVGVRAVALREEDRVRLVHDPNHPDADENGNVAYPDIDVVQEVTDMISAQRAYEASVTAINAAKSMAVKALEIGRS